MRSTLPLILCVVLALSSLLPARANNTDLLCDSLRVVLDATPVGEGRLELLLQLAKASDGSHDQCTEYTNQLLAEAEKQDNNHYRIESYLMRIILAYNIYDVDGVVDNFSKLSPLARQEEHYDMLFRGWRCLIDIRLLAHDYERNEREAQKMLSEAEDLHNITGILEAYQCLSNIYRSTFRPQKAAELLERAIPIAKGHNNVNTVTNIWQMLLSLYEDLGEMGNWKRNLDALNNYLHNLPDEERNKQQTVLLIMYVSYVNLYTAQANFEQAALYLARAEQYYNELYSPLYRVLYHSGCYSYYVAVDDKPNALYHIRRAVNELGDISKGDDYHAFLVSEANVLYSMGRADEALPIYRQIHSFKDSIHQRTINKQYEQLRTDFNADNLLLNQARIHSRMHLITLVVLILGVMAMAYFVCYMLIRQRGLRLAEQQMRMMSRNMELANEAKDRFLSNISTTISQPLNTVVEGSLKLANCSCETEDERNQVSTAIRFMSSDLLKVINDILDLSRLEAGMMKYDVGDVDLKLMILDAASVSMAPRGVDVRTTYADDIEYKVSFDAMRLIQLFTSLFEHVSITADQIVATISVEGSMLHILISGSSLEMADKQERVIRNEINRMLVAHFGGTYLVVFRGMDRYIEITLPIVSGK